MTSPPIAVMTLTQSTVVSPLEAFVRPNTSTAINMSGGTIGGDLSILDGAGVAVTGGTVANSSIPADILANHVKVVNDLVIDVDRGALDVEHLVDDIDRHVDAGAKAAGVGKQDLHWRKIVRILRVRVEL